MTEQEFSRQVWRMYDQITTADGVKGKVIQVAFNTKSVRAFISGAPEWIRCELIETHTTGKGADGDDTASIEELHNKVLKQDERIGRLEEEKRLLQEKISRNYLGELLRAVNIMQQGLQERKRKIRQVEDSLAAIADVVEKLNNNEE
jgi:predicted transposase YdaD